MAARDELIHYYERELGFIRSLAGEFQRRYSDVAGRLELEPGRSKDPHVERLIEVFALLAARIRLRLDDDFGEICEALLSILYPHCLNPIPSLATVQLSADPDVSNVEGGLAVERDTALFAKPSGGIRCRFRTCYPVTLWPLEVESTELMTATSLGVPVPPEARAALRIRLRTQAGAKLGELGIDRLRFYLDPADGQAYRLHELLLRDPVGLVVQSKGGKPALLGAKAIRTVGFEPTDGLLAYSDRSFLGFRLLQEYFAFPQKFLYLDFVGLRAGSSEESESLELSVLLKDSVGDIDLRVRPAHLKLGCTPVINLFPMTMDPIQVTEAAVEYPVVPDAHNRTSFEVHSVRSVNLLERGATRSTPCEPIFALRHGGAQSGDVFWYAARRRSIRKDDPGTDVFISLIDERTGRTTRPPADTLHVEALCSNRDLASQLKFGDAKGDLDIQGRPGVQRVVVLDGMRPSLRPPLAGGARWRLVSHLALNHLSLSGADSGQEPEKRALDALREILKLYDFVDDAPTRQRVAGLVGLRARPVVRRIGRGSDSGFARGTELELSLDPEQYVGSGTFLMAAVLETFFGLYTSANSFTQTVARTWPGEGVLKRWPPRAGATQLL